MSFRDQDEQEKAWFDAKMTEDMKQRVIADERAKVKAKEDDK